MKIQCAHDEIRDVTQLQPHPKNYNQHPEKQIELLAKIMQHQGWRNPITVSKRSGYIVAGHGRLQAAVKNGWDKCPVDLQDFETEADEYAHMVADNKIAELAETDRSELNKIICELPDDFDVQLLGMPEINLDPDFEPGDESDQSKLDETKVVVMECPHCKGNFEKSQAKIID